MQEVKKGVEGDVANSLKEFFKKWPRFYYFIFDFFGPVYFGGLSPKKFLQKYHMTGECYNLGSGARRIKPWIKNVDTTQYLEVDIVADVTMLPIKDCSVQTIICDQVLEHVTEPKKAVDEIKRILKPNSYAYISTPFMYPFHASPSDFQRWSHKGYEKLFSEFDVVEIGIRSGPFSTLAVYLCYFFATIFSFGNEKLYWIFVPGFTFLFFPIKFLDVVGNRLPSAINMSAVLYCVVRKKNEK